MFCDLILIFRKEVRKRLIVVYGNASIGKVLNWFIASFQRSCLLYFDALRCPKTTITDYKVTKTYDLVLAHCWLKDRNVFDIGN